MQVGEVLASRGVRAAHCLTSIQVGTLWRRTLSMKSAQRLRSQYTYF